MARVGHNIIANLIGRFWVNLINLLLIPVYIALLGEESWGLVGFYGALQAALFVLDGGLGQTMVREMARLSAGDTADQTIRDTFRTTEIIIGGIATICVLAFVLGAGLIASSWLNRQALDDTTVHHCVLMMGLLVALQLPAALYNSSLMGLQRQVPLNVLLLVLNSLRAFGSLAVVLVRPDVELFFLWNVGVSVLQPVVLRLMVMHYLPQGPAGRFDRDVVSRLRGFAAAQWAATALATLIIQLDTLVLSKLQPLSVVGLYAVAKTMANALLWLTVAFIAAVFPHFSQLLVHHRPDDQVVRQAFHRHSQLLAILLLPITVIIITQAPTVIFAWTGNRFIADQASLPAVFLVAGMAIWGLLQVPIALQRAWNWPQLAMWICVALLLPTLAASITGTLLLAQHGTAMAWFAFTLCFAVIATIAMHRRLLPDERLGWLGRDLLPVLVATSLPALAIAAARPEHLDRLPALMLLIGEGVALSIFAILSVPTGRGLLLRMLKRQDRPAGR